MRPKSETVGTSEEVVKDIRRATRKQYSAEEKIRIVLGGLAANTASLSCAGVRALPRAYITAGRGSSSRLATAGWLAMRNAPPAPAK